MNRKEILENAIAHTCGDREAEYGPPVENMTHIAIMWEAYLCAKYGGSSRITAEDVAWFNVLQKIARTFYGATKSDTYEDAAAYSAIAGECAEPEVVEGMLPGLGLPDRDPYHKLVAGYAKKGLTQKVTP